MKSFLLLFLFFFSFQLYSKSYFFDIKKEKAREVFNQGMVYYNNRSYELAINKFFESLGFDSRNNLFRYYLGMSFYKAGYTKNAIEQWENIIKLGEQDTYLIEKINNIFYLKGNLNQPKTLYENYVFLRNIPKEDSKNIFKDNLLKMPTGLFVDNNNDVFVVDFVNSSFVVINPNGYLDRKIYWKGKRTLKLPFHKESIKNPYEITKGKDDLFYISDFGNNRVVAMKPSGKIIKTFGKEFANENGFILGPQGIAFDSKDNVFISDTGNCLIHYYNSKGEHLYSFSKRGNDDGELLFPSGIDYDLNKDLLYVCDRANNRISIFSPSGSFIKNIGNDFLKQPRKILLRKDHQNVMSILDDNNVYIYNESTQKYQSIFHKNEFTKLKDDQHLSMAYDKMGILYIGSRRDHKIKIYSPMKLLYVNLFVQLENVYLREFPKVVLTVSVKNKEGKPLPKLDNSNFEIKENGIIKPFRIKPKKKEHHYLRPIILFEASQEAKKRKALSKAILQDLFESFALEDETKVYRYGGGIPGRSGTFELADNYDNSILKKIHRTLGQKYYSDFYVGTVLKKAIGENLKLNYKKGIIIVCFQAYDNKRFFPEDFDVLIDYASHNNIPIYVIYAGEEIRREDESFYYLNYLTKSTKGKIVVYKNRESIENLIEHMRSYQSSFYELVYLSFKNDLKKSYYRPLDIIVKYKGMVGKDNRGGYPIP